VNKQGQIRLSKYYVPVDFDDRIPMIGQIVKKCLSRQDYLCSFLHSESSKIVYRRYASLLVIFSIDDDDNEMAIFEFIHLLVETFDLYFDNVCELDIMFNLEKTHLILDEMVVDGRIVETNKKNVINVLQLLDTHSNPK